MSTKMPEKQFKRITLKGEVLLFWYLIAPEDREAGYMEAYVEEAYVTTLEGAAVDVPQGTLNKLIAEVFNDKEEP